MATTTESAIRERISAVVAALAPTSMSDDAFREWTDEESARFDDWAMANPQAAFRRFHVDDDGQSSAPSVSDNVVEEYLVTFRVLVAYPHDSRAGSKEARRRVMREDEHKIVTAIGMTGRENFSSSVDSSRPDACWRSGRVTRDERKGCDLLVIEQAMSFKRAV
jgi:hypothetical protein